jgi:hypothetical protein
LQSAVAEISAQGQVPTLNAVVEHMMEKIAISSGHSAESESISATAGVLSQAASLPASDCQPDGTHNA